MDIKIYEEATVHEAHIHGYTFLNLSFDLGRRLGDDFGSCQDGRLFVAELIDLFSAYYLVKNNLNGQVFR